MQTFFKPASYQLASKKWVPQYIKIIHNGDTFNEQSNSWDKQFNTKEEADKYAIVYCLQQGYFPANKK